MQLWGGSERWNGIESWFPVSSLFSIVVLSLSLKKIELGMLLAVHNEKGEEKEEGKKEEERSTTSMGCVFEKG